MTPIPACTSPTARTSAPPPQQVTRPTLGGAADHTAAGPTGPGAIHRNGQADLAAGVDVAAGLLLVLVELSDFAAGALSVLLPSSPLLLPLSPLEVSLF